MTKNVDWFAFKIFDWNLSQKYAISVDRNMFKHFDLICATQCVFECINELTDNCVGVLYIRTVTVE